MHWLKVHSWISQRVGQSVALSTLPPPYVGLVVPVNRPRLPTTQLTQLGNVIPIGTYRKKRATIK